MQKIIQSAVFAVSLLAFVSCSDDVSEEVVAASRAQLFARAEPYSRLILEVDAVEGYEPSDIDAELVKHLSELVDKPDGIQVVRDQTIPSRGADHIWTFDEMNTLFGEKTSVILQPNEIRIHVVFLDGTYEGDAEGRMTLGLSWMTNVAMFEANILTSCERPVLQGRLCGFTETAILLHEIGHVLGLVENGAPLTSDHLDAEHSHHCSNPDCLMYWEYEGTKLVDALRSRLDASDDATIFEFDDACKADLAAIE